MSFFYLNQEKATQDYNNTNGNEDVDKCKKNRFSFYNRNVRNVKPMVRFCDAVSLMPFIYLLLTRDITLTSNQAETSVMKFFKEVISPTKIGNNPLMSNRQKLMFAK